MRIPWIIIVAVVIVITPFLMMVTSRVRYVDLIASRRHPLVSKPRTYYFPAPLTDETAAVNKVPQYRVLYLCITSQKMFKNRSYHIWRTIGQYINTRTKSNNSFLRFVADTNTQMATVEEVSEMMSFGERIDNPSALSNPPSLTEKLKRCR